MATLYGMEDGQRLGPAFSPSLPRAAPRQSTESTASSSSSTSGQQPSLLFSPTTPKTPATPFSDGKDPLSTTLDHSHARLGALSLGTIGTATALRDALRALPRPEQACRFFLEVEPESCGGTDWVRSTVKAELGWAGAVEWDSPSRLIITASCGPIHDAASTSLNDALKSGLLIWRGEHEIQGMGTAEIKHKRKSQTRAPDQSWTPAANADDPAAPRTVILEVADSQTLDDVTDKIALLLSPVYGVHLALLFYLERDAIKSEHFTASFTQYFLSPNNVVTRLDHPLSSFEIDTRNPAPFPEVQISLDALAGVNLPQAFLVYDKTRQVTLDPYELDSMLRFLTRLAKSISVKRKNDAEEESAAKKARKDRDDKDDAARARGEVVPESPEKEDENDGDWNEGDA
ncbi:hypothetical protein RQP46_006665 [Phenoliferia psychrophenolica]